MNDPTLSPYNQARLFALDDVTVTQIRTTVETWPAGTFHYREALNAGGDVVYRSAYGPGATGNVNGY